MKTQRIQVSHLQEDFSSDVFVFYKNQTVDLRAQPRVVFEEELAVGKGPRREFFSILMKLIYCGFNIGGRSQVTRVFEGEVDHKIPIANALLTEAGFYKMIGKMFGHIYTWRSPFLRSIARYFALALLRKPRCTSTTISGKGCTRLRTANATGAGILKYMALYNKWHNSLAKFFVPTFFLFLFSVGVKLGRTS